MAGNDSLWQVRDETKDANVDFLLHVGMHLGNHGAHCSMRAYARCLDARLCGGRARNSACSTCTDPESRLKIRR